MIRLASIWLAGAILLLAGCARTAVADITITVDNLTDTALGLYVNDEWVGTYAAGASTKQPLGDHGGAPYQIELRSPSGATLAMVGVNEAQAASMTDGGPAVASETGVPCGLIRVVVGELAANEDPAPGQSVQPGPCP